MPDQDYRYIGPGDLFTTGSPGRAITAPSDLVTWLAERPAEERAEPCTFVVDLRGTLRLAPRPQRARGLCRGRAGAGSR
ncbi:hypothetical protein [Streptomyces sp. NBC_00996]|uniref:hypothetical protein n=1 Tax=Streptomyces sp. NBC_00996 TaxID=2903710 RepID=UPI003868E388